MQHSACQIPSPQLVARAALVGLPIWLVGLNRHVLDIGITMALLAAALHAITRIRDLGPGRHVGANVELALVAARRRDEHVEPARGDEAGADDEEGDVTDDKAEDMQRILAQLVKGRVGEAVDDGEDRGGDVADEGGPEGRDAPVLALADDLVEVEAELVSLVSQ